MATSAPNTTPDPRPTGDLEHLFRQKFAEAEVTPRAGLWEQLDNELLVEQNNTFRRKLSVHRWVAAACLLLLLSVSGWAVLHQWQTPAVDVAAQRNAATSNSTDIAAANQPQAASAESATGLAATTQAATGTAATGTLDHPLEVENGTSSQYVASGVASDTHSGYAVLGTNRNQAPQAVGGRNGLEIAQVYRAATATTGSVFSGSRYAMGSSVGTQTQLASNYPTDGGAAEQGWNGLAPRFVRLPGGWLGARPDTLKASLLAVPQPAIGTLAATQDETQTAGKQWRRLRLGGSYAASAYNPNINFSNNDGRVYADAVTAAFRSYYQEDAETEYRRNLRAGLSQRVAVTAAYALNKRWTLLSGVEAAQQRATSATSYNFVDGRQVNREAAYLLINTPSYQAVAVAPAATRKTSYRYRTMAIPVEIRYGSVRPGASLYAKVGAAVGVLLGSRSELEGALEATRTYSLSSTDSPYRQVQTSARGGAGVRYQPANASWNLALGTTAEMGLTTLNANPSQRGLNQSRPYSVGLEARVEFGGAKPALATP